MKMFGLSPPLPPHFPHPPHFPPRPPHPQYFTLEGNEEEYEVTERTFSYYFQIMNKL